MGFFNKPFKATGKFIANPTKSIGLINAKGMGFLGRKQRHFADSKIPQEQAIVPYQAPIPVRDPMLLANEELAEKLRNRLMSDQAGLRNSNAVGYRGPVNAPISELTQRARLIKEQNAKKGAPYSKKIETLLKKEGTGFSPEQSRSLLNMIGREGTSENLASERLQKQFGKNYGYETERGERLKGKIGKDTTRSTENAAANFKKLNEEFADLENNHNIDIAKSFHKAGMQKTGRRNALIHQLEEYGTQEHALGNLKNKAQRDVYDEEYEIPYRKIAGAQKALNALGPETDHPDKTILRNRELQRIMNSYNTPHNNYKGQRVIGMQPETQEAFDEIKKLSPKYRDTYHSERKGLERSLMGNTLPNQAFSRIPGALDPLMKNLDYLTKQQLKKETKELAGKHVRLGTYGSGSHKAENERNLRNILQKVHQEREGALTGVTKSETNLVTNRDRTALSKHRLMSMLGNQEFGNILDKNKDKNKIGWDKRSSKQAQENAALRDWYSQMQHDMGGVNIEGYDNLAKQYDTDLTSLFNRPQTYNDKSKAFNVYKDTYRKMLSPDLTSRKQLEDYEEAQRQAGLRGGDSNYQYRPSQSNLRSQAYAMARKTPVY